MYELETHTLDNGLRLHFAPAASGQMVAIQIWIGVGAADDPPARAGLAHLVEHLLFKGPRRQGGELAEVVERAGGEVNAWTSPDHTVFHAVVRRAHFGEALDALADALVGPRFEPAELERERAVVLQELAQDGGAPGRALGKQLLATTFLQHPYRRPVIGSPDSLQRVELRDVTAMYRAWYVGPATSVVIVGALERDEVVRRVGARLGGLPAVRPPARRVHEPESREARVSVAEHGGRAAHLAIAFPGPQVRDSGVAALEVAAIALAQRASFASAVGQDRGPVCYVRALRDCSLLVLEAAPAPRALGAAVSGLVRALHALSKDLGRDELERAQVALELQRERELETVQGRARAIGWYAAMTGDAGYERVHAERVRRLRRSEVAAALAKHVVPERAALAALVPRRWRGGAAFARQAPARVHKALPTSGARPAALERRHVLPNGMVVLVRRDPEAHLVAVRAAWAGGVRLEDARTAGGAALLARLLPRGCGKRRAAEVAARLDELGGSMEGVAGRNSFGLSAEVLAEAWRDGLELVGDCLLEPRLDVAEVEAARQEQLAELATQATRPGKLALQTFLRALYGAHPYHRDSLGTAESVLGLGRNSLRALYRERFPVSSLVLAVVGDVEPDEVIAQVSARFGKAAAARRSSATVPAPSFAGRAAQQREVYAYTRDAESAQLVVGFPGATVAGAERLPLEVLGAALGGQSGRLFQELRERRALAYQVAVHVTEGVDPGYLAVHVACAPERLDEAYAVIRAELERLLADGLTEDEVTRAKNYVIGAHEAAMQRRAAVAAAMAYHEIYGLPWQSWQRQSAAVGELTAARLLEVARAHLRWELAVSATVRPWAASPGAERRGRRGPRGEPPAPERPGRGRARAPRVRQVPRTSAVAPAVTPAGPAVARRDDGSAPDGDPS